VVIWKHEWLTRIDLSLEFLMGRALDNAMLNVEQKDVAAGKQQVYKLPLIFLTHMQRVSPTLASAWKMSFLKSTTPRSATAVSVVSPPASSTRWPR
jgi:hypothetical protein